MHPLCVSKMDDMAAERRTETAMVHLECNECGMTATLVQSAIADEAWQHHMLTHGLTGTFQAWTWTAVRLFDLDD